MGHVEHFKRGWWGDFLCHIPYLYKKSGTDCILTVPVLIGLIYLGLKKLKLANSKLTLSFITLEASVCCFKNLNQCLKQDLIYTN